MGKIQLCGIQPHTALHKMPWKRQREALCGCRWIICPIDISWKKLIKSIQFSNTHINQTKIKRWAEFKATPQRCGISKQQKKKQISCLYKKVYSKSEVWKGKIWYIEQAYYLYISETLHSMQVKKASEYFVPISPVCLREALDRPNYIRLQYEVIIWT